MEAEELRGAGEPSRAALNRSALVVGAGIAGLVAADALAAAGWEVTVLEARDRVGGRTWSRTLPNGATIEMGAEFVLPGNTEVVSLAERLGLGLWDKGMRYGQREPRGGVGATVEEMSLAAAEIGARLAEEPSAELSARELIESLGASRGAREAVLARVEISAARDASEVPAADLAGVAHIGAQPSPGVAGGNQGLALALAARLGEAVRSGDAVVALEWDRSSVRATTAAGSEFAATVAVIAVPASVIDAIAFRPTLPRWKRDAHGALVYGNAAKLFVPLAEAVAPSAVMNVPERYWCWTATGERDQPMPVLSCFAGSAHALERLEVATGPGRWLESVVKLCSEHPLDPAGAVLSTWDDDAWVRAAYSVSPPSEVAAALAEPVGPLAFAGEHTAGLYNGLMEGAIRSGRRAAQQLIAPA